MWWPRCSTGSRPPSTAPPPFDLLFAACPLAAARPHVVLSFLCLSSLCHFSSLLSLILPSLVLLPLCPLSNRHTAHHRPPVVCYSSRCDTISCRPPPQRCNTITSAGSGTMGTGVTWRDSQWIGRALCRTRGAGLDIDTSPCPVQFYTNLIKQRYVYFHL